MTEEVRAIGFRVEPSKFHWAVVSGTKDVPAFVDAGTYDHPEGESEAEALSSCRRETKDICDRYSPKHAWVRAAERTIGKRALLMRRCRGEGVIMATLDAMGLKVSIGPLGSIAASGKPKTGKSVKGKSSVKPYLEAAQFRTIDWSEHGQNVREAILAAVSALPT
jgi:hypothetical protein